MIVMYRRRKGPHVDPEYVGKHDMNAVIIEDKLYMYHFEAKRRGLSKAKDQYVHINAAPDDKIDAALGMLLAMDIREGLFWSP